MASSHKRKEERQQRTRNSGPTHAASISHGVSRSSARRLVLCSRLRFRPLRGCSCKRIRPYLYPDAEPARHALGRPNPQACPQPSSRVSTACSTPRLRRQGNPKYENVKLLATRKHYSIPEQAAEIAICRYIWNCPGRLPHASFRLRRRRVMLFGERIHQYSASE